MVLQLPSAGCSTCHSKAKHLIEAEHPTGSTRASYPNIEVVQQSPAAFNQFKNDTLLRTRACASCWKLLRDRQLRQWDLRQKHHVIKQTAF